MYHLMLMGPFAYPWPSSLDNGCPTVAKALSRYSKSLRDLKLLPYTLDYSRHSINDLYDSASKIEFKPVGPCRNPVCSCIAYGNYKIRLVNTQETMHMATKMYKPWAGCLDCFKSGGMAEPAGEVVTACRTPHNSGPIKQQVTIDLLQMFH